MLHPQTASRRQQRQPTNLQATHGSHGQQQACTHLLARRSHCSPKVTCTAPAAPPCPPAGTTSPQTRPAASASHPETARQGWALRGGSMFAIQPESSMHASAPAAAAESSNSSSSARCSSFRSQPAAATAACEGTSIMCSQQAARQACMHLPPGARAHFLAPTTHPPSRPSIHPPELRNSSSWLDSVSCTSRTYCLKVSRSSTHTTLF